MNLVNMYSNFKQGLFSLIYFFFKSDNFSMYFLCYFKQNATLILSLEYLSKPPILQKTYVLQSLKRKVDFLFIIHEKKILSFRLIFYLIKIAYD